MTSKHMQCRARTDTGNETESEVEIGCRDYSMDSTDGLEHGRGG